MLYVCNMIRFNTESITFQLKNKTALKSWIKKIAEKQKKNIGELNYIFCSDEYLLAINQQYLNHNTYTDIITFDYSDEKKIAGDIFISIDRVKENAGKFSKTTEEELHRVMIHGVLHLLGYKDKSKIAKQKMRKAEDDSLKQLKKIID